MIPTIGIMVGCYIITRCLSVATNRVENWVTIAMAYVTIIVTILSMIGLVASGSQHIGV